LKIFQVLIGINIASKYVLLFLWKLKPVD
jgi:hypothetical protein